MTEEEKTKTEVTPTPNDDAGKQEPQKTESKQEPTKTGDDTPSFDLDELRKEIDSASNSIVSEDVRKLIETEKQEARKQALKEAEKEQYLKDKEAEIAQLKKEQEERERQNASQLDALKQKIDQLASSKQVVPSNNPFQGVPTQTPADKMKFDEKELDSIERDSFYALVTRRPKVD